MRSDKRVFMVGMTGVLAGLFAGVLMVAMLPAVAAVVGDPLELGEVNKIDDRTDLKGAAKGANLQIKNTGNARALSAKADKIPLLAKATSGPVAISAKASRNAIKIKVDDGQAPIKVNPSAGTATNLSADLLDGKDSTAFLGVEDKAADSEKVDGFNASQLVRAAHGETPNAPDANGAAVTATITAPRPGVLVMGGSIDANGNTEDLYTCRIHIDGVTVPGSIRGSKVDDGGGEHTDNDAENCSTDGAQEVAAGSHTVTLLMADRNTAAFLEASVWVIWVPFDGTGHVPSP